MNKAIMLMFLIGLSQFSAGQDNTTETLAVSVNDFSPVSQLKNSDTKAIVLLDSGATILDADDEYGFFTRVHHFKRILILNKSAFDLGVISLNFDEDINKYNKDHLVKAATYNLIDGKVVKTNLVGSDFFMEKSKGYESTLKFAFPRLVVGSIIEFEYNVRKKTRNLQDWYFQTGYPVLKSVYTVQIPNFFNFIISIQGKQYLTSMKIDSTEKEYNSVQYHYAKSQVHATTWEMENIPPMVEEPFTSTIDNYIACVKFQLSVEPYSPGRSIVVLNSWDWVNDKMLNNEDFGIPISKPGQFIKKESTNIVQGADTDLKKAKSIYNYVRNHSIVTERGVFIEGNNSLENIYKSGKGNTAEINLLLIALLRSQNLHADPIILATRDNGLTNPDYPVMSNFNYVIVRLNVDNEIHLLDASDPFMIFGKIPSSCYNGNARVIAKTNFKIYLSPDSIRESQSVIVTIKNNTSGNLVMDWAKNCGFYESSEIRSQLKGKNAEGYVKESNNMVTTKFKMDSFKISNAQMDDDNVNIRYSMEISVNGEDHVYFTPMMNVDLKENPLRSAERNYPIELPFLSDHIYVLNMEIPNGYEVEEMPKSIRMRLDGSDAVYDYLIEKTGNTIQLKSMLIFNRTTFDPEDYNTLRDFYGGVIKKENEVIVFKKIR